MTARTGMKRATAEDVERFIELRQQGMTWYEIGNATGFGPSTAREYAAGMRIAQPAIRQRLCQTDEEWTLWQVQHSANLTLISPCDVCPMSFALEMRAIDRCDGEPAA